MMTVKRVQNIAPSKIRELFEKASKMDNVISLGIGEPDFDTPQFIKDAAVEALKEGKTKYTPNLGILKLREAISEKYKKEYDVELSPDEILMTVGAYEAVYLTFEALIDEGDEVIIPDPAFPCYVNDTVMAEAKPVRIDLKEENEFRLTPEDLNEKITEKTKMLITCYPNNPTGAVLLEEDYKAISEICEDHDIFLLSDDVYEKIVYDYRPQCFKKYYEKTVITNSFSKTYAMTGWRIGFVAAEKEYITPMLRIHQYAAGCLNTPTQEAAYAALKSDQGCVREMVREYRKRRDYVVKKLNEMGLKTILPKGTFYCYPNISSTGMNSVEFSNYLLEKCRVVVVPGTAFGDNGKDFVRVSFATSLEKIKEAMERIENVI
ncbi:MAG: pyridoxal phosphate-dependent aminotransferase [Methanomicrobia archaeon]|nr:pyridoxal phosphate-dependent aminotransferase [Methanomicrobia archaeon]